MSACDEILLVCRDDVAWFGPGDGSSTLSGGVDVATALSVDWVVPSNVHLDEYPCEDVVHTSDGRSGGLVDEGMMRAGCVNDALDAFSSGIVIGGGITQAYRHASSF